MYIKQVSLVALFAALAVVLSPTVSRIQVPFFVPGLAFQFFEVPIVIAVLFLGPKPGVAAGLIAWFALLPLQPTYVAIWGIAAWLSMITGVYVGYRLVNRKAQAEGGFSSKKTVLYCTLGAIIFRVVVMAVQNYVLLRYPIIGLELPEPVILAIIPPIALFNVIQSLLVVPLGYFLARTISSRLRIGSMKL